MVRFITAATTTPTRRYKRRLVEGRCQNYSRRWQRVRRRCCGDDLGWVCIHVYADGVCNFFGHPRRAVAEHGTVDITGLPDNIDRDTVCVYRQGSPSPTANWWWSTQRSGCPRIGMPEHRSRRYRLSRNSSARGWNKVTMFSTLRSSTPRSRLASPSPATTSTRSLGRSSASVSAGIPTRRRPSDNDA